MLQMEEANIQIAALTQDLFAAKACLAKSGLEVKASALEIVTFQNQIKKHQKREKTYDKLLADSRID
jgi:hypothetical protein